jgi:putative glutamine amidotransferase
LQPVIGITAHRLVVETQRTGVGQAYVDAVIAAGGAPLVIPLGAEGDTLLRLYSLLDGLLLPGGDDVDPSRYGQEAHEKLGAVDPGRDELELTLAQWALRDNLPVFGICRGVQVLAVAGGGTLYQHVPEQVRSSLPHDVRENGRDHLCHVVAILPDTVLAQALGPGNRRVNSLHHQSVRRPPEGFVVSARADDNVIEAIEAPHRPFTLGVQWHPEAAWSTTAPEFGELFRSFVLAASEGSRSPV